MSFRIHNAKYKNKDVAIYIDYNCQYWFKCSDIETIFDNIHIDMELISTFDDVDCISKVGLYTIKHVHMNGFLVWLDTYMLPSIRREEYLLHMEERMELMGKCMTLMEKLLDETQPPPGY